MYLVGPLRLVLYARKKNRCHMTSQSEHIDADVLPPSKKSTLPEYLQYILCRRGR